MQLLLLHVRALALQLCAWPKGPGGLAAPFLRHDVIGSNLTTLPTLDRCELSHLMAQDG